MHFNPLRFAALLAYASLGSMAIAAPAIEIRATIEESTAPKPVRRRKRRLVAGRSSNARRSRGPQAKPKRRPNRLTVSKRVRRRHRRAA